MTRINKFSKVSGESFLDIVEDKLDIDMNDPLDVALLSGLQLLSRAFEERQKEGFSRKAVQRVLEEEPLYDLAREYPSYDPGALLILAWAAMVDSSNPDGPIPSRVVWANHIMRRMLDGAAVADGRDHSDLPVDRGFSTFLAHAAQNSDGKGDPRSAKVLDEFALALNASAAKLALNKTFSELRKDRDQLVRQDAGGEPGYQIEIFRYFFELDEQPKLIVGVRVQEPAGIFLRFGKEGNQPAGSYFDIYAVWKIALPAAMGSDDKIEKDHFVSVQGVFIPVDLRHKLEAKRVKLQDQWRTAALVARNMSHNLGSHAMLHLSSDLSSGKLVDSDQLSTFLRYLVHRSDIVAMLASGQGHPFSVALSPGMMIEPFNDQRLIHRYLCRTEDVDISPLEIGGNITDLVECPGGLIGSQALCAILENFARNSAKHSLRRNPACRKIQLRLELEDTGEGDGPLIRCRLYDQNAAEISQERLENIQQAVAELLKPGSRTGRAQASHKIGLGMEETVTWARYLRQREVYEVYPPVIAYEKVMKEPGVGSLALIFYLLKLKEIQRLESENEVWSEPIRSQSLTPAQINLLVCRTREQLMKKISLPGRWLKVSQDPGDSLHLRSRFADADLVSTRLEGLLRSEPNPIQVYDAYLTTLKKWALPQAEEPLHLIIVDSPRFRYLLSSENTSPIGTHCREISLGITGARLFVVSEVDFHSGARITAARILEELDLPGKVAIWHRHQRQLPSTSDHPKLANQLIHYETFNALSSSEYDQVFDTRTFELPRLGALMAIRLAECALLKGFVIDERFQFSDDSTEHRLAWAGVRRIDPFTERYGSGSLIELIDRLVEISESAWEGSWLKPSFVTIHASLARSTHLVEKDQWNMALEKLRNHFPCIALHSGRGGVEEAEGKRLPFLPASLLQHHLFDHPAKLFFTEALVRAGWIDEHD